MSSEVGLAFLKLTEDVPGLSGSGVLGHREVGCPSAGSNSPGSRQLLTEAWILMDSTCYLCGPETSLAAANG